MVPYMITWYLLCQYSEMLTVIRQGALLDACGTGVLIPLHGQTYYTIWI
jgi:hypothetical protein